MSATMFTDIAHVADGDCSIRPQAAITATTTGGAIDLSTNSGPTHAIVAVGATDFTSGDETYSVKLQESSTSGGTYTDIAGASVNITAANGMYYISTNQRLKRYVKAVLTIGGTTPSTLISVFVFGRKEITGTGTGTQLDFTPGSGF